MALAEGVDEEVHHSERRSSSRREFLRAGLAGFGRSRCRGCSGCGPESAAAEPRERTAVILVWLRGGCSHLDTYDPKPDAPSEYRGPFATIATRTPGLRVTELLPRQAAALRPVHHPALDGAHRRRPPGGLAAAALRRPRPRRTSSSPFYPDFMSVANYLRVEPRRHAAELRRRQPDRPLRQLHHRRARRTSAPSYEPFAVTGDPSARTSACPNIGLADPRQVGRLRERVGLRQVVRRPPPRRRPVRRHGRDGPLRGPGASTC